MRKNALKLRFQEGRGALNGWLHIPSPVTAEAMAHQGFDSLTIDLQHGPLHFDAALPMLQATAGSPITPLARVPWNEPGIIMKLLDAGCYGIICPMINTREACEAFVGACRYPPFGYRSFGPTRARFYAGDDYAQHANDEILTFAMIETAEAVANLDDILSTPGLDAVYIGPADLSQTLGGPPGADFDSGPVPEAVATILAAAQQRGVIAGIHSASSEYAKRMLQAGFQFVTVQSDLLYLVAGAQATTAAFQETGKAGDPSGPD